MRLFGDILRQKGDDAVILSDGKEQKIKAIINPVIGERYLKKWKIMTELGEVDEATYYFFGPPECEIKDCDESYIFCNGKSYRFIRAELYRIEGVPSHWEGVLKIREEEYHG